MTNLAPMLEHSEPRLWKIQPSFNHGRIDRRQAAPQPGIENFNITPP